MRCEWAKTELDILYHDHEWCIPHHQDSYLFEFLVLEEMQAGLSWETVLRKREAMRAAFSQFDVEAVAAYTLADEQALLLNPGIIRNRLKIHALVTNAQAFIKVQQEFGSFDRYIWAFTAGKVVVNRWQHMKQMPANTPLSDRISADLKKRGFKFVGTTIIYSYLQAIGMVNDHMIYCDCSH